MSSFGNAVERWSIADVRHPINSNYPSRLSPAKSFAAAVDSAYSSFSGSPYATDYHTSFQSDIHHLNDDQRSYMDSEYVKAIYNPSAVDQRYLYSNICSAADEPPLRSTNFSLVDKPKSLVCPLESYSPPRRLDCSASLQDVEQSNMNDTDVNHFTQNIKRGPTNDISPSSSEHKMSRHHRQSPTWKKDSDRVQVEDSRAYSPPHYLERKEDHHYTKSSFSLKSFNQNVLADEVSYTHENKSFPHTNRLNKEYFTLENLGPYSSDTFNVQNDDCLKEDECLLELSTGSTSAKRPQSDFLSEGLGIYNKSGCWVKTSGKETRCYSSEGTIGAEVVELASCQQQTAQNEPLSQSIMDTDCENHEQWNIRQKWNDTRACQAYNCELSENANTQSSRTLHQENEGNEGTKIHSLRKDATIKTIPMLSLQVDHEKSQNNIFCDLTSEKITKEGTPMLYHLSGGHNNLFKGSFKGFKQGKQPENSLESKNIKKLSNSSVAQVTEIHKEVKQLLKNKSQSQLAELTDNPCSSDGTTGSLTSSAEECFMHDYREKLKVAQKKVLRETSFKRKDLQMSLPGRLKLNPPKRPTIDHLRSYSLSSANEESKFVQSKTSFEKNYKKEETEKSTVSRIGGRKRITKEQRKLCYSEPEKLDHLGIQNSGFGWREEGTISNQRKTSNPDIVAYKVRSLDSKERTLSSSNLSKTELKQIQQNALMQYMERKTSQRPSNNSQAATQRMSGIQKYDRKSMPGDISFNERAQTYLHRRSTGASSSYDATVTWTDRFVKTTQFGDYAQSSDLSVEEKCMTYLDQCTLGESKRYFEDYPPSVYSESKPAHVAQVSNGHMTFSASTSALYTSHSFTNRLSVTEESVLSEGKRDGTSRGRGKSMEEIGTKDIVRLSVLSQSTDQLYHMKEPVALPRTESASSTSVVHQEKLRVSTKNELGNLPSQTSREDFVRPHRSDVSSSARDRHSRPSRTSAISSATDNSTFHPGLLSGKAASLETEDEVFSQAVAIRMELASRIPLVHQEDIRRPASHQEETPLFVTVPSGYMQSEQQIMSEPITSSESVENEISEDCKETRNYGLLESTYLRKSPIPIADREESTSAEPEIISNSQQEELLLVPSSQVNAMDTSSIDQSKRDVAEHESKASILESSDPDGEWGLPTEKSETPGDERHAELVKDIIAEDKSLVDILKPLPVRESAMDLIRSLFPMDISEMEKCRSTGSLKKDKKDMHLRNRRLNLESISKLPPKTMLLLQKNSHQKVKGDCPEDITSKKMELISNICFKLEDLCEEKELLLSDISENISHGKKMEAVVKEICKPNEYERYMMFIGDLEKVVSLLFCLSMRLARVENALSKSDDNTDAEEMQSLKQRHNLLSRQREDAKDLKENLDRRESVVTGILAKYLSERQLQDYKHFVRLKTSFLIEQKDLDEKIKFHEEQLESLHNSIPP
ncbi:protein Shroom1 [Pelodytes ibericus]